MFLRDFERRVERGERRHNTLLGYRSQIAKDLNPVLGSLKIGAIRRADLRRVLDDIVVRAPILANRVRALMSAIFHYAEDQELINVSPAVRLKAPAANHSRSRVLDREELHRLFAAKDNPQHRAILLMALLTAGRKGEVLGMRWDEVDVDGWWTIPAARSKNHRQHRLFLVPAVRDALAGLPKHYSGMVFGGPERATQRNTRWFGELCGRVGIQDATFHDLRRSASSHMNRIGVESSLIERILNHARGGVEAVYNRYGYSAEIARALTRWERELLRIIEGETASNVVALHA